jgi:glycosyltransferase involved in cell wall biosynthesis
MKISVIIPTYNYGKFIKRAIESVLSQDFPANQRELLIIDGGSTDETQAILKEYDNEKNLRIFFQPGKGISNAVNFGINQSLGKYISRIDADDVFYQGILTKEADILDKNPEIGFVYTDYFTCEYQENKKFRKHLPEFCKQEILERGDFLSLGTMFRKTLFETYGYYDEKIQTLDGYDMILRLMINNVVGYHIDQPLFEYTIHENSMYNDNELIEKTGRLIAKKYGLSYTKNQNHPRQYHN